MNFTCRKLKCENNSHCVCKLNKINISEKFECEMFNPDTKKVDDTTKTMFEKVPKFGTYKHHNEVAISCKANCIFNNSGECMANGIVVNQTNDKHIKCVSFLKK